MTTILFACTHNAGRSQMAAAFCTHLAGGRARGESAGTAPGPVVAPGARRIDWPLDDPNDLPLDRVRLIRDDIEARVRAGGITRREPALTRAAAPAIDACHRPAYAIVTGTSSRVA